MAGLRSILAILPVLLGLTALMPVEVPDVGAAEPAQPLRVGMPKSLFRDLPQTALPLLSGPLTKMLQTQTGVQGSCVVAGTIEEMTQQIESGKLQLGVYAGHEFAWARQQCPDLRPLVIAVAKQRKPRAFIVCRTDSKSASFADLKGQKMAVPFFSREHCHIVLDTCLEAESASAKEFFGDVTRPANLEAALDHVVQGKVDAALVDSVAMDWYKQQKPGCYSWVKVITESVEFPSPVVAYHPQGLDGKVAKKLKDALTNAQKTAQGKELLSNLRLTAFEPVPDDYEEMLGKILKAYPAPEAASK
ncbi:MAG: phosphate/phosphite/phosphonate ABC transporter substrate-binding protein [Gemmataceae bacterium]|nr:phosphate/phosphite/phosphonate ABC transporter substrate-binding protein [Gemmataceae bacterium]